MPISEDDIVPNVHILRASVFILVIKHIIAWLVVSVVYLLGAMLVSHLNAPQLFATFWSGEVILLVILFLYAALILYVTLDWNSRYCIINSKGIIIHEGVVFSKAVQYDMAAIESISLEQGLLGKLFNFGTLEFYNPHLHLSEKLKIQDISDPRKEADFIGRLHPNPVSFIVTEPK